VATREETRGVLALVSVQVFQYENYEGYEIIMLLSNSKSFLDS